MSGSWFTQPGSLRSHRMVDRSKRGHLRLLKLAAVMFWCVSARAGDPAVRGIVRDARTGEPLARVAVQLAGERRQILSGRDGAFELDDVAPGDYLLKASTVGYRLLQTRIHVEAAASPALDLVLTPEAIERRD